MIGFKKFLEQADFKVKVDGLPDMFLSAKSAGDVRSSLKKIVKTPDMIQSVERTTKTNIRKIFRDKAAGKEESEQ